MRNAVRLMVGAVVLALPAVVSACPMCIDERKETRTAYIATTAALSIIPVGFGGGILLWVRARMRAIADGNADGQD